ncbi:TPA: hypothetical protein ACKP1B_000693 [Serratia fonticola]
MIETRLLSWPNTLMQAISMPYAQQLQEFRVTYSRKATQADG